ncbi:hypothetical protein PHYBOEH_003668 [Phytophthora boehmeriae]|uniref:Uncharacterized protein n=1 Tax=Phytophthora boehmeriae TaxID=109152 RepID=A0A8T1WTB2_9STRA|nr:hypothetical protein PHYBOEH_003668 [Phytophthora boehmeriae]
MGEEIRFDALSKRVFGVMNGSGVTALLDELLRIQHGPNGHELLQRLAQAQDSDGSTLLVCAAEPDSYPPILSWGGVWEADGLSDEEFAQALHESEVAAEATCRLLVDEAGADVNHSLDGDETALFRAVVCGCEPVVRFLLQRGAHNDSKFSALSYVADIPDYSLLKVMIENGADVLDEDGATILTPYERAELDHESRVVAVCRFLVDEAGADVNQRFSGGRVGVTVLNIAIAGTRKLVAKLLLDRGADSDSRATALYNACYRSSDDMLLLLLQNGADTQFIDGYTPLTKAAMRGNKHVVCRLMALGVDISRRDASGRTTAEVARCESQREIASMITVENQQEWLRTNYREN